MAYRDQEVRKRRDRECYRRQCPTETRMTVVAFGELPTFLRLLGANLRAPKPTIYSRLNRLTTYIR